MTDQRVALAAGFLVAFSDSGADNEGPGIVSFPLIERNRVRRADPDLLTFLGELGRNGGTIDEVIERTLARRLSDRARLLFFARALHESGFVVTESQRGRFADAALVEIPGAEPAPADELLRIPIAASLLVDSGTYLWYDHAGTLRLRLTDDEMIAVSCFRSAVTADEAWSLLREEAAPPSLDRQDFDRLIGRLQACGLLRTVEHPGYHRTAFTPLIDGARDVTMQAVDQMVADADRAASHRGNNRVAVVPVHHNHKIAPVALGMLYAYSRELDGGRLQERYDFVPSFLADVETLVERATKPTIFLFSNYIWNFTKNLESAAQIKAANPKNITIHGGPSTPKYEKDAEDFFAEHPHVDIAVRGEGEATLAAILDILDGDLSDLDRLRHVTGLTYRAGDGVVRTEDRERIADLDTIPSPYLLGLFDPFGLSHAGAVLETNRGCPYGCTFCDWGSATLSRIRKFSLDRVMDELEWSARNGIMYTSLADANFGILERDVEIAQRIADLKRQYGYPQTAALNYAKNTLKHLRPIIEILAEAEMIVEPTVALQSMDEHTLKIIRRSNIKLEKYNELTTEFRRTRLPLAADVMMGLPGSTLESFRTDLQKCTDRDVRVRANPTVLLPNSPMNEPSYREEHGITAKAHEVLRETSTYTEDDYEEMERLRRAFYVFDNFGVLRHVAHFVRSELGIREVEFYDRVSRDALDDPLSWPILSTAGRTLPARMAPPVSWGLFMSEVRRYVTTRLGVESSSALETTIEVQLGHLPATGRPIPVVLELDHDFVAWNSDLLEARESGRRDDWETVVPRLGTYPPGDILISDPTDVCNTTVGKPMLRLAWNLMNWELDSPIARARVGALASN